MENYEYRDFGWALNNLRNAKKVAREGWNGKGMFIYYVSSDKYIAKTEIAKSFADDNGLVEYNAYIAIKNVNGTVSTWVPSINDCLSEDWIVIK